jgi:hypothetical protein
VWRLPGSQRRTLPLSAQVSERVITCGPAIATHGSLDRTNKKS